jgi:hypothetical protein
MQEAILISPDNVLRVLSDKFILKEGVICFSLDSLTVDHCSSPFHFFALHGLHLVVEYSMKRLCFDLDRIFLVYLLEFSLKRLI